MLRQKLTWSALIATYQRPDWVVRCVRHALAQTLPPDEVVVVAAEGDDATTARIFDAIPGLHERVCFVFLRSARGSTVQRNAGLSAISTDICMLVDDDLLLAPDCMEHLMAGFAADEKAELGAIQGEVIEGDAAHAWLRAQEGGEGFTEDDGAAASVSIRRRAQSALRRGLWQQLFRYIGPFFPANRVRPAGTFPGALLEAGLVPADWLRGGCTAFRSRALGDLRFCELFTGYAAAEDVDLSVRIAQRHSIARCPAALGYHFQVEAGRPDTARIAFAALLNLAYTARTAFDPGPDLNAHVLRHHRRFARSWALMGALAGRGLSDYRACRMATEGAARLLNAPDGEVEATYRDAVRRFEARDPA